MIEFQVKMQNKTSAIKFSRVATFLYKNLIFANFVNQHLTTIEAFTKKYFIRLTCVSL